MSRRNSNLPGQVQCPLHILEFWNDFDLNCMCIVWAIPSFIAKPKCHDQHIKGDSRMVTAPLPSILSNHKHFDSNGETLFLHIFAWNLSDQGCILLRTPEAHFVLVYYCYSSPFSILELKDPLHTNRFYTLLHEINRPHTLNPCPLAHIIYILISGGTKLCSHAGFHHQLHTYRPPIQTRALHYYSILNHWHASTICLKRVPHFMKWLIHVSHFIRWQSFPTVREISKNDDTFNLILEKFSSGSQSIYGIFNRLFEKKSVLFSIDGRGWSSEGNLLDATRFEVRGLHENHPYDFSYINIVL